MRDGVSGIARCIHQFLDLIEHGIDPLAQPVKFVARSAHRHAPAKLAAHDRLGRARQFVRTACCPARDQDTAEQRQDQANRRGDEDRALDPHHDGRLLRGIEGH